MKICLRVLLTLLFFSLSASSQTWTALTRNNSPLKSDRITSLCLDSFGSIWVGSDSGLTRISGETWHHYTPDTWSPLKDRRIRHLEFEMSPYGPEIWIATPGGATVAAVDVDAITAATSYQSQESGLISNSVTAIALDTGHVKYFGTPAGVSLLASGEWPSATTQDFLNHNEITSLAPTDQGWMLIGTRGGGVNRLRYSAIDGLTGASPYEAQWCGLASDSIYTLLVDEEQRQWMGTAAGLSMHQGDDYQENWLNWTPASGLPHSTIQALTQDQDGLIWVGTPEGVASLNGQNITVYTTEDGLPHNHINALLVDDENQIWAGTARGIGIFTRSSDVQPPPALHTAISLIPRPNPFNLSLSIDYDIPSAQKITISLYNVAGQCVKTLLNQRQPAGTHHLAWDASDTQGRPLTSGLYLIHLRTQTQTLTRKITLIK